MSAFPHAEKFIEVTRILATEGSSPQDLAKVLGFMSTLVRENAEKDEALAHFAAENQRLNNVYTHALKKHNEQRGAANDLRDQLASLQQDLQASAFQRLCEPLMGG